MRVTVPYGNGHMTAEIDRGNLGAIVRPNSVAAVDTAEAVSHALSHPSGSYTFDEFLSDAEDIVVVVNDRTRSTPTSDILEHISPALRNTDVRFVVATGSHRAPSDDECRRILGSLYDEFSGRISAHDARSAADMVRLGTTSRGTEVRVNRLVARARKIVAIGSVQPHYFAGFTGGRKSFLPGVASYETIEQNHSHALSPEARSLVLNGNPVHEDMAEAVELLCDSDIFSIQAVLDGEKRLHSVEAGDITESLEVAAEKARRIYAVAIEEKADIVVAVAPYPPVDNLYQTQHALDNGRLALNDGGIIILVSECRAGVGNRAFVELAESVSTPAEVLEKIAREGYKLGYHKTARMAEMSRWASMWAVTGLEPEVLESVFMRPFGSLQEAIDEALRVKGPTRVLFLTLANLTVPHVD